MCQQIVFGTDYGPRKFVLGSGAAFLCKKPLFYGPVESYFAAYDSVVLTGPNWSTVTKSWMTLMSLSHVTTATSTRCIVRSSCRSTVLNVWSPSCRAAMGVPRIELDVSSKRTQGQRGSGFSANSTVSYNCAASAME